MTWIESTRDDTGASAVEYGLLLAGIAAVIIVVVVLLGGQVAALFTDTCDSLNSVATPSNASSCS